MRPLDSLLRPRSVAVIGGSSDPRTLAGRSLVNLRTFGFAGPIYPVNPRHAEIQGLACYPDVGSLPEVPETAIVAVPAQAVLDVVRQCDEAGVPSVTILSSGFGEDGDPAGAARLEALTEFVRGSAMRVLGPGSIGVVNMTDRAVVRAAAHLEPDLRPGPLSIVSHSGGVSLIALNRASAMGVGLDLVVPTGAEVDVRVADVLEHIAAAGGSRVVCLYIETLQDGRRLVSALEACRRAGITVLVLHGGTSAAGRSAVATHTGGLAGDAAAAAAALATAGAVQVPDLDALCDTSALVAVCGRPAGNRVAAVCISGGEAVLVADRCADLGLALPPPSEVTVEALGARLAYGTVANPLDLTGQLFSGDRALASEALGAITADPRYDVVLLTVPTLGPDTAAWLAPVLDEVAERAAVPLVVSWGLAGSDTAQAHAILQERGLVVYGSADRALEAIALAAPRPAPTSPFHTLDAGSDGAAAVSAQPVLTGAQAIDRLRGVVPFVDSWSVGSLAEATAALEAAGPPVALKVDLEGLGHKSEVGGVHLWLATEAGVRAAWGAVADLAARRDQAPRAVVQPMVMGVELLVGCRYDPSFGPMITVAAGGVAAELWRDVQTRPAPVDAAGATAMIQSLRVAPTLTGYRGGPVADMAALSSTVSALSTWFCEHADAVAAAELNPVIIAADGRPLAVDALIELTSDRLRPRRGEAAD